MEERCRREVVELHRFFEGWFRASLPGTETRFARLADVLAPTFVLISPEGSILERGHLLDRLRRAYGRHRDGAFRIEIDALRCRAVEGPVAVVTYVERQSVRRDRTVRLATAVFREALRRPNGVEWLHVHETWLAPPTD